MGSRPYRSKLLPDCLQLDVASTGPGQGDSGPFSWGSNSVHQPRDPQELQEELDLFAHLRSQFKGPPLTSAEIIAAIDRDSHPPEPPGLAAAGKVSH